MGLYLQLLLGLLRRAVRSRDDLLMENLVLRQQLAVFARRSTEVNPESCCNPGHGLREACLQHADRRVGATGLPISLRDLLERVDLEHLIPVCEAGGEALATTVGHPPQLLHVPAPLSP